MNLLKDSEESCQGAGTFEVERLSSSEFDRSFVVGQRVTMDITTKSQKNMKARGGIKCTAQLEDTELFILTTHLPRKPVGVGFFPADSSQ